MSPRWHWDFEDQRRGPAHRPSRASAVERERRVRVRRRRAAAAVVILAVLALILAVASGSSHPRATPRAGARVSTRRAKASPRPVPEDDQNGAVASVLGYTPFVKEGSARAREIALTFDDGPGPYTPRVLDVLERLHVHATFFEIGAMLRYFSASTVRELGDGDVIGDHTETHPEMARLSAHDQREELFEQIARIELLDGPRPVLFRPPYGSYDATTMRELHALHLLMVLWSVDTEDYLQPGVPVIVQRALAGAHPGAIILMHDAGGTRTQTIEALPTIIRDLRARGFRLVTVPQLLRDDPPPPGQALPSNLSGD
ncbi:MAG: polysaccharide deacetylase family protein [Solirubrobacteraceae bacterium]|jgi:peptidoglycan/xylan/chitin deacetylase (PgdA/CDA1 family)